MDTPKIHYFHVVLTALCVSFIILTYLFLSGRLDIVRDVRISELVVCSQQITFTESDAASCGKVFPESVESIFVCGYMDSGHPNIDGVAILMFKNMIEKPIYVSPTTLQFRKGSFCHEIFIVGENRTGLYAINFYYFRNIIASVTFEIQ